MPVNLATQHTTAAADEKRLPSGIQEMEDRRKAGLGGYFVTDSMLRANDERKLTYFFAAIPRIHQVLNTMGSGVFLASPGPPPRDYRTNRKFPGGKCDIDIFVNGARYFVGPAAPSNPPPDFDSFWAREYSGIEYYPGGASVPAQLNGTGGGCGLLLLWTRR
jgi:hypothetical protein